MIAELQKAMGVEPEAAQQQQPEGQGPMGPPQGGAAPVPDEQGFTGTGGGDNGGQPQPQQAPPQQPPQG